VLCGAISRYNEAVLPPGPSNYFMSTPEQKCIGWPEQKYIIDAGKKAAGPGYLQTS
jgi:hypothetical protein